jgi:hypothetical protein
VLRQQGCSALHLTDDVGDFFDAMIEPAMFVF